ncbi:MAG: prenyltransferase [Crocinitomicaceae bacterium]
MYWVFIRFFAKHFDWNNIYPAITIGLLSTAVLNLNNMRDYFSDKNAQKNTLVVQMGINNAKIYHTLLIIIALVVWHFYSKSNQVISYIALLPAVSLLLHVYKVAKVQNTKAFDPELSSCAFTFAISVTLFHLHLVVK